MAFKLNFCANFIVCFFLPILPWPLGMNKTDIVFALFQNHECSSIHIHIHIDIYVSLTDMKCLNFIVDVYGSCVVVEKTHNQEFSFIFNTFLSRRITMNACCVSKTESEKFGIFVELTKKKQNRTDTST